MATIIVHLNFEESAEWCNSFVLVSQTKWEGMAVSGPSMPQPSTNLANAQASYSKL